MGRAKDGAAFIVIPPTNYQSASITDIQIPVIRNHSRPRYRLQYRIHRQPLMMIRSNNSHNLAFSLIDENTSFLTAPETVVYLYVPGSTLNFQPDDTIQSITSSAKARRRKVSQCTASLIRMENILGVC